MGELASWAQHAGRLRGRPASGCCSPATLFRPDNTPIPWVSDDDDGVSGADDGYGYTDALIDGVCRPVTFHTYDGDMEWVSDGRRWCADFTVALPAAEAARRLRTALDPEGDWVSHALADAHRQLVDLRAGDHPDAGGLVIAADKEHAERIAGRLARIAGERPDIVTSDAADAPCVDLALRRGIGLVAGVRADGLRGRRHTPPARRRVRHQRAHGAVLPPGRRALHPAHPRAVQADGRTCLLPSDPVLKRLAGQVEEERNHALIAKPEGEALERGERGEAGDGFHALWSSVRRDDDVMQTTAPGDALQLFAEAAPAPSPALAAFGGGITSTTTSTTTAAAPSRPAGKTAYERRERLREERRALVSAVARRTGEPHSAINGRVNRDVGAPSVAKATVEQLEKANRLLEREAAR